jgi:hypothetical protein
MFWGEPEDISIRFSFRILSRSKAFYTRKLFRKIFRNPMITFAGLSCLSQQKANYKNQKERNHT